VKVECCISLRIYMILDGGVTHPLSTDHPLKERRQSISRRRRTLSRTISERGCCLSTKDHERIKTLVHEFIVRALIPWAERLIRSIWELVSNDFSDILSSQRLYLR